MGVNISRNRGETRRSEELAMRIAGLGTPCVGCRNCRGLCAELIEALVLPDVILGMRGAGRAAGKSLAS